MTPRYIMIGGFLGAGKTTTIARLARHFAEQGRRVGIVTNDQTTDLVDTQQLRSQGFDVGEVAGSCFCCNFAALTTTVQALGDGQRPEVILAEPVGSCTDLVATVLRPLAQLYGEPLEIAPYGVILKPSHGRKILSRDPRGGFSPQAEYIFRKQLEEADFILINRSDQLTPNELSELTRLVEQEYPRHRVLSISARTGDGFPQLLDWLQSSTVVERRTVDVDYEIYAAGEAELGWLNGQVAVTAATPFALDNLLTALITDLHEQFLRAEAESAHLKIIGLGDGSYAVANLVSNAAGPELSLASQRSLLQADLVVNARVATDPRELDLAVRQALANVCQLAGIHYTINTLQSFRPGRPIPTHRLTL